MSFLLIHFHADAAFQLNFITKLHHIKSNSWIEARSSLSGLSSYFIISLSEESKAEATEFD